MKEKLISIFFDGKFTLPLKYINILCYYIIPLGLALSIIIPLLGGQDFSHYGKELGGKVWFLLLVILFIKPLSQIFSDVRILSKLLVLRRQMGVVVFWIFLGHYSSMLYDIGLSTILSSLQTYGIYSYFLWGILAGWIVFFLGITSNIQSVKILKKNWKRLHRLIYPALVFAAIHIYLIKHDISPFIFVGIYGVLKIMVIKKITIPLKKYFKS